MHEEKMMLQSAAHIAACHHALPDLECPWCPHHLPLQECHQGTTEETGFALCRWHRTSFQPPSMIWCPQGTQEPSPEGSVKQNMVVPENSLLQHNGNKPNPCDLWVISAERQHVTHPTTSAVQQQNMGHLCLSCRASRA